MIRPGRPRLCWAIVAAVLLPAGITAADRSPAEQPITADDRSHWAFRPPRRPAVPRTRQHNWCRNPIDAFILARIEAGGLDPAPAADRSTLLRRACFDLTGLPPTTRQMRRLASDRQPDAWERVVDSLLDSPAYGVRWAQHWLDLARFAETDGFEHDKVRPQAWKYRDWVVEALNRDMPFDRFIELQLAGDELDPASPQSVVATGFLLCGPDMPDINLLAERRHNFLNDMTATVGSVLMGLQFGCAQCHDHKYDPISQYDFYRLRAFFEHDGLFAKQPEGRVVREPGRAAPASFFLARGDFRRRGPRVSAAFPRIINAAGAVVPPPPAEARSSHRRAALARWLTRPDHPLTARIIVNRLWQHHFGHGLCPTPSDVGLVGEAPSHPELLDWLASELVRRRWSLKQLHRLLVTSATWRQASRRPDSPAAAAAWQRGLSADPDNELLARANRRRLDGESLRDAMLAVSGLLSQRRGGPGIRPPLPPELVATLLKNQWPVSKDPRDHHRRSLYLFVRRNLRLPLLETFDRPDTNASCPERTTSTTATQSLTLMNSKLSTAAARALAGRVKRLAGPGRTSQARLAWLTVLNRLPDPDEQRLALELLDRKPTDDRLSDLCLALFNTNEFLYVD